MEKCTLVTREARDLFLKQENLQVSARGKWENTERALILSIFMIACVPRALSISQRNLIFLVFPSSQLFTSQFASFVSHLLASAVKFVDASKDFLMSSEKIVIEMGY